MSEAGHNSKCAIFYTTDEGYLFPTLVSALSVKSQISDANAEVRLVLTGFDSHIHEDLYRFLTEKNIIVSYLDKKCYNEFDLSKFNKTHVPISCLARFFMTDSSPGDYERILYLDGDTWINDSISELIAYETPPGYVAAAEGASFFYRKDIGPTGDWTRQYFKGIGIEGDRGYFNSGILAAHKDSWKTISMDAFLYFIRNIELCKYHDESALNAVAFNRRVRLSPRWNFVTPYWDWGVDKMVRPAIFHFAGGVKPWRDNVAPFNNIYQEYQSILKSLSHFNFTVKPGSAESVKLANRRALAYRIKINTILLSRKISRRSEMAVLLQNCVV